MRNLALPRTSSWRWAAELRRAAVLLGVLSAAAGAQDTSAVGPYARATATWIALAATPGYERFATDRILGVAEGWKRDRTGNLVKVVGEGSPRRVIACGIDETGY